MSYKVIFDFLSKENLSELNILIEKLDWQPGRQETGYLKAVVPVNHSATVQDLVLKSLNALDVEEPQAAAYDCYILKYPAGSMIPRHKDDAPFGSQHWRLNSVISNTGYGGKLFLENRLVELLAGDAVIFRPDAVEHYLSKVCDGTRYVWSVGILK